MYIRALHNSEDRDQGDNRLQLTRLNMESYASIRVAAANLEREREFQ